MNTRQTGLPVRRSVKGQPAQGTGQGISKALAIRFLAAAEALRKGLGAAACVMQECPACNKNGAAAALKVWRALDLYEPAAVAFAAALQSPENPQAPDPGAQGGQGVQLSSTDSKVSPDSKEEKKAQD